MFGMHMRSGKSGFTLIEMLITMAIFSVLLAVLYPTFSSVSKTAGETADREELLQKGQRVMDFIAEQFRMAGLFVGGHLNPRDTTGIVFCGQKQLDAITHVDQNTAALNYSDQITYFTSERTPTDFAGTPFLQATKDVKEGGDLIEVNADGANVSSIVASGGDTSKNAQAFITFDNLKPSMGFLVYQVTSFDGAQMVISPAIDQGQAVRTNSNVYAVERRRISVDASRNLKITKWNGDCTESADSSLISSFGTGTQNGGVDGFQVNYTWYDSTDALNPTKLTSAPSSTMIERIKSMTIWLLVRSDFKANNYTNTEIYTLGSVTVGPFNDSYRRLLLTKTVEVKNVGM